MDWPGEVSANLRQANCSRQICYRGRGHGDFGKQIAPVKSAIEAVKGIGAERVIYGSDWNRPEMKAYGPFHTRACFQHWWVLNEIAMADITEEQRDMILYKNALRLLKQSN